MKRKKRLQGYCWEKGRYKESEVGDAEAEVGNDPEWVSKFGQAGFLR